MRIFGREPTWWALLVALVVQGVVALGADLTTEQQAGINAVTTLGLGLVVAAFVARDQILPAVAGLAGAVVQLLLLFDVGDKDSIVKWGALITAGLTAYIRTQVTAPVAEDGSRVPKVSAATPPGHEAAARR
jgi:hypothetical protein